LGEESSITVPKPRPGESGALPNENWESGSCRRIRRPKEFDSALADNSLLFNLRFSLYFLSLWEIFSYEIFY